jgi:SnoaL-like protein
VSAELDIAKGLVGAFDSREEISDEQIAAIVDPSIEIHEEPDLPGGRVWSGYEGARAWRAELWDRWEAIEIEVDRWIESSDVVVMLGKLKATGKGAGVTVDAPLGQVFEFTDGRFSRLRYFRSHEQALELAASLDRSFANA